MKKNQFLTCVFVVFSFIPAAFALSACQPTPIEDAVVNKGEGQLEEKIEASPVAEKPFEAPATLHIDSFGTDEFQVAVDADVIVPNTTRYPVVEIEAAGFFGGLDEKSHAGYG